MLPAPTGALRTISREHGTHLIRTLENQHQQARKTDRRYHNAVLRSGGALRTAGRTLRAPFRAPRGYIFGAAGRSPRLSRQVAPHSSKVQPRRARGDGQCLRSGLKRSAFNQSPFVRVNPGGRHASRSAPGKVQHQ